MNRKKDQAELLCRLGQLIGPLLRVAQNPNSYDTEERHRIRARFTAELPTFRTALNAFALGEPGHNYEHLTLRGFQVLASFSKQAAGFEKPSFLKEVNVLQTELLETILSIPTPVQSAIHEAHTPFSTYCLVKDLCSTAKTRVSWMDRYFDHSLFHRYFTDVPTSTSIVLVTWPESKCLSQRDRDRYKSFLDVSRLFAQERGPASYRLVTSEDIHDRWLRCDDRVFTLGGSIKDLGQDVTFTISKVDVTRENLLKFDEAMTNGTELFGPAQLNHL